MHSFVIMAGQDAFYRILNDMTHRMTPCCELKRRKENNECFRRTTSVHRTEMSGLRKTTTNFGVVKHQTQPNMNSNTTKYSIPNSVCCLSTAMKFCTWVFNNTQWSKYVGVFLSLKSYIRTLLTVYTKSLFLLKPNFRLVHLLILSTTSLYKLYL